MNREPTYLGGFVDALALVMITLLIIGAAVLAGGCAHRQPPPPPSSTGTVYTLISVEVVELDAEVQP